MFDFLPDHWTLTTLYMTCAAIGGAVVVIQLILGLIGLDGDELDGDVDLDGDGDFQFISIRAIAGFLTMFGLAGWAGTASGWNPVATAAVGFLAGSATFVGVGWLLTLQRKLDSSGNLDPSRAVGADARVYLTVPSANSGRGKITVELQGRTAEFPAFTLGDELPTGTHVRVVRMASPGVFEVAAPEA